MSSFDRFITKLQRNWRIGFVVCLFLFVIFYPVYWYIESAMTHGITHRGNLLQVDLKAMSTFLLDQDNGATEDIPRVYRELDGKRVLLTGDMWAPVSAAGQVRRFDLVYSRQKCCLTGPPLIQHFVKANVVTSQPVQFYEDQVNVVGTLHVGVVQKDGHVESVYRVDVESVEPVS